MNSQSLTRTATKAHALRVKCGTTLQSPPLLVLAIGLGIFSTDRLLVRKFSPLPLNTKG